MQFTSSQVKVCTLAKSPRQWVQCCCIICFCPMNEEQNKVLRVLSYPHFSFARTELTWAKTIIFITYTWVPIFIMWRKQPKTCLPWNYYKLGNLLWGTYPWHIKTIPMLWFPCFDKFIKAFETCLNCLKYKINKKITHFKRGATFKTFGDAEWEGNRIEATNK